MNHLIEIQTVPIEIQMKVTNAKLEYARGTADLEISRDRGGIQLRSQPIKVNIDTFEARNSLSPTAFRSIEQYAQKGNQMAYEATSVIAREGRMMMEAKMGQSVIPQLARNEVLEPMKQLNIQFLPQGGAEIAFEGGELSVKYELDKLNFDWRMNKMDLTFTPGDIEFVMTQRPDIIIKYVGGPMYVPPSSDPDYEPVDVKA